MWNKYCVMQVDIDTDSDIAQTFLWCFCLHEPLKTIVLIIGSLFLDLLVDPRQGFDCSVWNLKHGWCLNICSTSVYSVSVILLC